MTRYRKGSLVAEQVQEIQKAPPETATQVVMVSNEGTADIPTDDVMELSRKIREFVPKNEESNRLGKQIKSLKEEIKTLFTKLKISTFSVDDMVVAMSETETVTFDEEVLLAVVKDLGMTQLIKIKEVVDLNELEKVLYDRNVPDAVKAQFSAAQVVNTTTKLTAKRKKSKKGHELEPDMDM